MEIKNYDQAAEFVNSAIPSGAVKEFLFGFDNVMAEEIEGVGAINKMLILQFSLIYLKWLGTPRYELVKFASEHYRRVADVLSSMYKERRFSLYAANFVLKEAYDDVIVYGEKSFFAPLVDASEPCPFGNILSLVDDYNHRFSSPKIEDVRYSFVSLVKCSKAVAKADVSYKRKGESVETMVTLDAVALKSYDVLYTDKTNTHYILTHRTYEGEDVLCHYMAIDDLSPLTIIKKANRRNA